jgi:hypothetical protein
MLKYSVFFFFIAFQSLTTMGMQPHQQGSEAVEMAVYIKKIEYLKKEHDRLKAQLLKAKAKRQEISKRYDDDIGPAYLIGGLGGFFIGIGLFCMVTWVVAHMGGSEKDTTEKK